MNMTPIRQSIFVLAERPKEPTMRDALDWFKTVVRANTGALSALERKELDGAWAAICGEIAEREKVPVGSISYMLNEIANTEIRLADTANDEANAAGIDYVEEGPEASQR